MLLKINFNKRQHDFVFEMCKLFAISSIDKDTCRTYFSKAQNSNHDMTVIDNARSLYLSEETRAIRFTIHFYDAAEGIFFYFEPVRNKKRFLMV